MGRRAMAEARFEPQDIAIALEQPGVVGFAKPRCGFDEGIEHDLQIEGRAADHLQHVSGRGLLLQRLPQVVGARLDLIEQPDVLDGNDRLVGKRGDQLDLLLAERLGLGFGDKDHAGDLAITQQGRAQRGAKATDLLRVAASKVRVGQHVRNMHDTRFQRASAGDAGSVDAHLPDLEEIPETLMDFGVVAEA